MNKRNDSPLLSSHRKIKQAIRDTFNLIADTTGNDELKNGPGLPYIFMIGYRPEEIKMLPGTAINASVGCGNPIAIADLREGEVVLDLGCGSSVDILMAAQRIGDQSLAIGVDMCESMIKKGRRNAEQMHMDNVQLMIGDIEELPIGEEMIDVIISNASISLSPDKVAVFREAFRVLKPGGRMILCDPVRTGEFSEGLSEILKQGGELASEALMDRDEFLQKIADAGFTEVEVVHENRSQEIDFPICSIYVRAKK